MAPKLCCTLNPIRRCYYCEWIICGDCFATNSMRLRTTSIVPMHKELYPDHEGDFERAGEMTAEQIAHSWGF